MGKVTAHPEIIHFLKTKLTRNDGWKGFNFLNLFYVHSKGQLGCLKENTFLFYCVNRLINDNVNNNDCAMEPSLFLYTIHIYFLSPLVLTV